MAVKRVAAVNDLSGFGRCSLTVAIPVLSAMGFQVCPLPTALLSAHTGYPGAYVRSFTEDMEAYLRHWDALGLHFDGVYTGFLGDERQIAYLEPFVAEQKRQGTPILVDPAMADHGKLYATCTPELARQMRGLVALADVITPNLTEACLLTDSPLDLLTASPSERLEEAGEIGRRLLALGCGAAVITGIAGGSGTVGNLVVERDKEAYFVPSALVERGYAGTGDVFSSVLCGKLLRGLSLEKAVRDTTDFVYTVAAHTLTQDTPEQDGIEFEPFLSALGKEE